MYIYIKKPVGPGFYLGYERYRVPGEGRGRNYASISTGIESDDNEDYYNDDYDHDVDYNNNDDDNNDDDNENDDYDDDDNNG
jgi:hypothetical protein